MKKIIGDSPRFGSNRNPLVFPSVLLLVFFSGAATKLVAQNQDAPPVKPDSTTPATDALNDNIVMPPPVLQAPKSTKNEISASGDFLLGQGTVTLPLGYSLKQSLGGIGGFPASAFSVPRNSTYFGGTVAYSYGQAWYFDLSYAQGQSSGSQSIDTGFLGQLHSNFQIQDEIYQAYIRYTFPKLRGKRLSAYVRAGVSYVTTDLKDDATSPAIGRYTQRDTTTDILGNLGFGVAYSLYKSGAWRFGLQAEGEGFYGTRTQTSLETLSADTGLNFVSANINNSLYGGIFQATFRAEYSIGHSGLFKVFGDFGAQIKYTLIEYPGAGSSTETLWGPYVRLGLRYNF
ncbi:MAG: autotransporter outer membrane beta-barrel domain-containing protein [Verrucomicrobiae bacterium]|nr:autotransporter outer membrane beta-barrel domain-containing protein [Verrucomicrobiae bacterium]